MKKLIVSLIFTLGCTSSTAQQIDTNIESIRTQYNAYLEDFIARDADQIASHFQFPAMSGSPARTFNNLEEITSYWSTYPLQNGYAYSTVENIAINRLSYSIYSLVFDYTRYDASDKILFEGSSVYLYGNESGAWKIMFQSPGVRQ